MDNEGSRELFLEFQEKWNLDRIKNMTLEEYTNVGENRDDFTFWIENKLSDIGSIWGGSSFKFGIYKQDVTKQKIKNSNTYIYKKDYAWLKKLGNTKEEVFGNVKQTIIKIIEYSHNGELDRIDKITEFGPAYKWKIAFHYQNIDSIKIIDIFQKEALKWIIKEKYNKSLEKYSEIYREILQGKSYPLEYIREKFAIPLWNAYDAYIRGIDTESQKDSEINEQKEKAMSNAQIPLNQILYGPPGTGKTYQTINKALEILGFANNNFSDKFKDNLDYEKIQMKIDEIKTQNSFKELNLKDKYLQNKRAMAKALFDYYKQEGQIEFVTFHQNFSYEEFIEGIKPESNDGNMTYEIKDGIFKEICKKAIKNNDNPYILIIDEINRGNISKILGELITLIEPSKRIGESEEIRVKLPYSNEDFGVPSNLYIIATMNTADKSLTSLDTALRRRFEFSEMMPDLEFLKDIWLVKCKEPRDEYNNWLKDYKNNSIDEDYDTPKASILSKMLEAINNRIEFLLDREHTIGHAFFFEKATYYKSQDEEYEYEWHELTLEELKTIFQNKIIPLLQEYFYDDYAKIDAVLNKNGMIEKEEAKVRNLFSKLNETLDLEDKIIYKIKSFDDEIWDKVETYKNICSNDKDKPDIER